MKKATKILLGVLSLSALTSIANAATPGGYAGLGIGASKQETPNEYLVKRTTPYMSQSRNIGGFGGRLFGGYNFNNYFGLEAGFAGYAQSKYKTDVKFAGVDLINANVKYSMIALDLVGKAYLPLSDSGFNLYGLGGAALVRSKVEVKYNSIYDYDVRNGAPEVNASKTNTAIRPIVGAGVSYDIPQTQLTTSLEYSHMIGRGDVKKSVSAIPSADMLTLNLAYNFG